MTNYDFTGKSIKCETWEQMLHLAKLAEEQGYKECNVYGFKQSDFNSGKPFFTVDGFREYSTFTNCKYWNTEINYDDFTNTLPTETIEVTGCEDCPFHQNVSSGDYCGYPKREIEVDDIFLICPLKKSSITIKLKQNDTTGN